MLSFFRKRIRKEQAKLMYQNNRAFQFCKCFMAPAEVQFAEHEMGVANERWGVAGVLDRNSLAMMLKLNRDFRRIYDRSLANYVKSFDSEFMPLLGWSSYYELALNDVEYR